MEREFETSKKIIKNGMLFHTTNDKTYLKVGKKCVEVDLLQNDIDFEEIKEEEITMIFRTNGKVVVKK